MNVKGILFDSGDTLVFPKGGSWWPGPDFHPILQKHGVPDSSISPDRLRLALAEGERCLGLSHPIMDCSEEKEVFRSYYRAVCRTLGFAEMESLIEDLACAYVDGCSLELYTDTVETLERLTREGVTLGVLSDAWPSLERKYATLGIRDYFKSFTVSAAVGCWKPDDRVYHRAIRDIGIGAEGLLFVDDDTENVRAAIRLGMKGAVISRGRKAAAEIPCIENLRGILAILP